MIDVSKSIPVSSLDEWMNYDLGGEIGIVKESYIPKSQISVGGKPAWVTESGGCCGALSSNHIFVYNDRLIFDIFLNGSASDAKAQGLIKNQETFDQILSTFKFTL